MKMQRLKTLLRKHWTPSNIQTRMKDVDAVKEIRTGIVPYAIILYVHPAAQEYP
jgi:hypothetical protein